MHLVGLPDPSWVCDPELHHLLLRTVRCCHNQRLQALTWNILHRIRGHYAVMDFAKEHGPKNHIHEWTVRHGTFDVCGWLHGSRSQYP